MDFTKTEQTQQVFNPELPAVRSERTMEDQSATAGASGIPGALSNQPPAAANIPETLQQDAGNQADNATAETQTPVNRRVEAERNYDLDTTISHIKQQVGVIRKVSVSVGLDYIDNPQDPTTQVPMSNDQITNITRLIRGAIGYNPNRGDQVEVESFNFVRPEALPTPAPLAFYEQPLFQALWKPVTALLLGLVLIFGLLKPLMSKLTKQPDVPVGTRQEDDFNMGEMGADTLSLGSDPALELPGPQIAGSPKSEKAKGVAGQDPTMVAQLVKNWVEEDE